jgi:sRNA-binding carbon storage regulator CsrA
MLALRRKKGQDIYITVPEREKPIRVTVQRFIDSPTYGMEVELGFDCEDDVEILRHELYEEDDNRGNK